MYAVVCWFVISSGVHVCSGRIPENSAREIVESKLTAADVVGGLSEDDGITPPFMYLEGTEEYNKYVKK